MKIFNCSRWRWPGYFLIITMLILLIRNGVFRDRVYAQEHGEQKTLKGMQLFWDAQFDKAIAALRADINSDTLDQDDCFSAYMYLGFSLIRLGAPDDAIDKIFRQAVRTNSIMKPDSFKIPPDLFNRFDQIRREMIGSIYITSNPSGAKVIGYKKGNEIKFQGKTPLLLKDLLVESYDILLSKNDYQEKRWIINLLPAVVDTVNITLSLNERPFYKKWWTWAGGGVAIASIVALVAISESPKSQSAPLSDLPIPPDRPR